jgi:septum formation protein
LDCEWRVAPGELDEHAYLVADPTIAAVNVAVAKARATTAASDEIIVAADTLVVVDSTILVKPLHHDEARGMLARLRGRPHHVVSGVALRTSEQEWAAVVDTLVMMRAYTDADIEAYIARGEPFDKAGGYAVQDHTFRPVERLEGCYLNVVGFPLCAVAAGLTALGVKTAAAGPPPCAYCERGAKLVRSGY